jgi:hypothetical protein
MKRELDVMERNLVAIDQRVAREVTRVSSGVSSDQQRSPENRESVEHQQ